MLTIPCMFETACFVCYRLLLRNTRYLWGVLGILRDIATMAHDGTMALRMCLWGGVLHGACRQPTTTMPFFSGAFHCGARMPEGLKNALVFHNFPYWSVPRVRHGQTYSRWSKMLCTWCVMLLLVACWNRLQRIPREESCNIARYNTGTQEGRFEYHRLIVQIALIWLDCGWCGCWQFGLKDARTYRIPSSWWVICSLESKFPRFVLSETCCEANLFAFLIPLFSPKISLKHIEAASEIVSSFQIFHLLTRYGYLYLHQERCDAARGGVLAGFLAANRLT